ncbi:hypothetical protein B5G38_06105 [Gemmiger sp. An87]|nr:hypothetical protein B5G38_06105 [Gemmiger sp. An87]
MRDFCVVFGHALLNLENAGTGTLSVSMVRNIIYAFHMPLFMMISGYLYRKAYFTDQGKPKSERIKRQIFNIVIVYLVYSLLLGISKLPFERYVNGPSSISDILLIPVKPFQLYWYLYALIILYLIFLLKVFRGKYALPVSVILCAMSQLVEIDYFAIKSVLYYSLFFCIGIKLCKYGEKIFENYKALIFAGAAVSIALMFAFGKSKHLYKDIPGINMIVGAAISLFVIFVFKNSRRFGENKVLVYLGKHSMEIYLVHTYFTTVSKIVLNRIIGQYEWLQIVLMTACGIIGSVLVGEICSRIKISNIVFHPITLFEKKTEI